MQYFQVCIHVDHFYYIQLIQNNEDKYAYRKDRIYIDLINILYKYYSHKAL